MSLWGSIISAVGNAANDIFGGGNNSSDPNDPTKKKQNNAPVVNQKVNLPTALKAPGSTSQTQTPTFNIQPIDNSNLTAQPVTPPPVAPHPSLWGSLLHGAQDISHAVTAPAAAVVNDIGNAVSAIPGGSSLISADKGIGLAGARTAEGFVQGIPQLADLATHGVNKVIGGVTGADMGATNRTADATANTIEAPIKALAIKTDQATQNIGQVGQDLYKPAQIAMNVGTIVPAATELATKLPVVGDAAESLLSKVPGISVGKVAEDTAPTATENIPPETGTKPIETKPTNAPSGETAEPTPTPTASESGVKPVATPTTPTPTPQPVHIMPDGSTATPLTTQEEIAKLSATPADVAAEQAAAQNAVNQTAETVPKPVPAPEATAPNVTPTEAASESAAASPQQQVVNEAPNIEKNGDLQNATAYTQHLLKNGRDYGGSDLQQTLDLANSHLNSNSTVAKILNSRLGDTLTDSEAKNVRNAIESGSANGLNDKEGVAYKAIQEHIENPSNTVRTNLNSEFQPVENHFPQVGETSVRSAAKGASTARGVNSKINTFDDLLNRDSKFSQNSTLGKFTDKSGNTTLGNAPDLGLTAKKDGTFVDKAGKVYNYSRATSQELENSGVKLQAPKDALAAYTRDTLNLKTRADAADHLIKNADDLGLSENQVPGKTTPVTIKGSDGEDKTFFTDKKTAKDIQDSGIIGNSGGDTNLGTKAWNTASSGVAQATVMNPTVHTANLGANAFIGAGPGALTKAVQPLDDVGKLRMSDAGVHFPTYGKDNVNALSKLTHGGSKVNEQAMAFSDEHIRAGMFKELTENKGLSDKQAAQRVNDYLGGRSVYNKGGAQLGIFWKYFVRQNVNAVRILVEAAKGHPQALINAGIAAGATYGADKAHQAITGNQGASVHAPGIVGIANDYLKSGEALAQGHFRDAVSPILNHVNPLINEIAKQSLGVDNYGNKFKNGAARVDDALGMTPVTNMANNNGHSVAEKVGNTFGLYEPHIKGDMATNNPNLAPILNVKGAQNGGTVAFPKDFSGEQENKAYNDSLGTSGANYSTKGAASFANQTQSQQQATTNATKVLKTLGVTNASEIQAYSKLSGSDQKNYQTAAQQVLKAGNSVSSTSVQDQLIKNGHLAQAAAMDTGIPTNLSQNDKNTLETYARGGSTGQKNVWLQDNNNANNYYNAVINQKQAQKALTTNDTDMGATYSGSGGSLYVKAAVAKTNQQNNVPQSLVELYKNTTKTEYGNMSGTQKTQLTQYAQQLNTNGVTDKFGIATGTSSGSSSSKNNLPSGNAVVMPGKSAGITAGTVKYVAPTLAKATVGTSKNDNPFIRSVSATKGVK